MKGTFHIHTSYSFDTLMTPARIVNQVKFLGLDFVAITDHDNMKGALEASALGIIPIIIGAEYFTEKGDIIGLFLTKEVISRKSDEVISEIRNQGGVVVLPHPCREHKLDSELLSAVDIIEVFNSKCNAKENKGALELAREYKKIEIAGSDAHFLGNIGLTEVSLDFSGDMESDIRNGRFNITKTSYSKSYCRIGTGLINFYKTVLTKENM
ncbi:MAG: PHP domain-containing protein [bacterium]|nr:PHP domain-containing protein [bacterium]